eukprot:3845986-Prymnesium_polylepis.1
MQSSGTRAAIPRGTGAGAPPSAVAESERRRGVSPPETGRCARGASSTSFSICLRLRRTLRRSTASAYSCFSSNVSGTTGSTRHLPPSASSATKMKKARHTVVDSPVASDSLETDTPTSIDVLNALFTCPRSETAWPTPTRASASKCTSSIEIVTQFVRQWRSAARHAVMSIWRKAHAAWHASSAHATEGVEARGESVRSARCGGRGDAAERVIECARPAGHNNAPI